MKTNLDRDASQKIIDAAVHTHAQIVVEPSAAGQPPLNAFLVSADANAILAELTARPRISLAGLIGTDCHVQLFDKQRYYFAARIIAAPNWSDTSALAVSRPAALTVLDRRRFVRAKLAPSSRVVISWDDAEAQHRHQAATLNVSADGIACRIEKLAVASLIVGDTIHASFELPDHPHRFELDARISNMTPAGQDHMILGMSFTGDRAGDPHRALLHATLDMRSTLRPEMEVPA
jgi:hypothetical protein